MFVHSNDTNKLLSVMITFFRLCFILFVDVRMCDPVFGKLNHTFCADNIDE